MAEKDFSKCFVKFFNVKDVKKTDKKWFRTTCKYKLVCPNI